MDKKFKRLEELGEDINTLNAKLLAGEPEETLATQLQNVGYFTDAKASTVAQLLKLYKASLHQHQSGEGETIALEEEDIDPVAELRQLAISQKARVKKALDTESNAGIPLDTTNKAIAQYTDTLEKLDEMQRRGGPGGQSIADRILAGKQAATAGWRN